jgi:ATP-dependent Clp protease ATP-binding subunit ClpA
MRIHPSVIDTVCEFVLENLTDDELLDGQLPGHAKQWIERCVAEVQLRRAEHPELYPSGYMMDLDVLFFTYSLWTGVDEHDLGAARTGFHVPDPLGLEERLAKQVVGQDAAVEAVSNAIMNVCAGLRDTRRPVGAFLFLGPTGVGKTELAKAVTRELYGSEQELLRFDMSEYQHDHEVSRLIGAPPGYVGYYEGGQLTEAVKKRPYSVVLLDEIDKAHPDVLTAFLQVFDEGHLTDGQGTTVDFRNCLFIMTCNLFSSEIAERMKEGQTQDEVLRDIEARLASRLRPELYNRMDAVVPFNRITSDVVHVVVPMMLSELAKDLSGANLKLTWSDACVELLGELGYSEDFGLRPLKRRVMHKLRNLIARAKLEGKFDKGDTVFVDAKDGVFEVRKADA